MRHVFQAIVCAVLLATLNPVLAAEKSRIGQKVDDFKLHDFRGAEFRLADLRMAKFVVVAFLGTECPLAKMYGPRLAELRSKFEEKGIAFLAIDSNEQDTLAEMGVYAKVAKIEFPFLKDPGNGVADAFGAARTPEVFVLDQQRTIRYHGRIDDQYGVGFARNEPTRQDLAVALDELLAGTEVTTAQTTATGCHIGRVHRGKPHGEITYAKHIAPLIQEHCVVCHRPGEVGPFALQSREDVVNWSATIREAIKEQRMPPWHAESEAGHFVNDRRMTDAEKKLLFDWIDNGMPAGNASDLPKPRQFADGWQIPKPDVVLEMAEPYSVPASGTVEYQYFDLKAKIDKDTWIIASEARPGNRAVVHHMIVFYVPPNYKGPVEQASLENSVASFAPGVPAWQAPKGMARRIPAGSRLFVQVHYTPNGAATTDRARVGLVLVDPKTVDQELLTDAVINPELEIPPKANNHLVKSAYTFPSDVKLISLLPHMHLRGKAFRIESVDPKGDRKLLLDVPRYDFNWQNNYVFASPLLVREGTHLVCSAWYDNSEKNPSNPDSTATVHWGDQTWEEMSLVQFETVGAEQHLLRGMPKVRDLGDGEYEVQFNYQPSEKVDAVYLAGEFNEWKPDALKLDGPDKDGNYSTKLKLKAGVHEYKFVIDGKTWRNDPGNSDVVGKHQNSVLRIPQSQSTAAK